MSGNEILVDTNIIIYLLQGDDTIREMLEGKQIYVSFMTELELFDLTQSSVDYDRQVEALLGDCHIVSMNNSILQQYKLLRKSHKLKLVDSLIAATSLTLKIPIVTADKQFKDIKALQLIQYER